MSACARTGTGLACHARCLPEVGIGAPCRLSPEPAAKGRIHVAKKDDVLLMRSMGKSFRILAIADNDTDANAYMARNTDAACIATFGPFVFMASKYDAGVA
jgi:hypothetical protein